MALTSFPLFFPFFRMVTFTLTHLMLRKTGTRLLFLEGGRKENHHSSLRSPPVQTHDPAAVAGGGLEPGGTDA
jgi:hypothetical protein